MGCSREAVAGPGFSNHPRVGELTISLHKMRFFPFSPRIVGDELMHSSRVRWMIVKQKYVHRIRLGITESNLSGDLEIVCRGLSWVRHNAVRHLEGIDIGLVFEVAA